MKHRLLYLSLVTLVLGHLCGCSESSALGAPQPNALLIAIDDLNDRVVCRDGHPPSRDAYHEATQTGAVSDWFAEHRREQGVTA